jgi:metal-responsive CopG/Arc/MetJ family transcriptional regulator
MKTEIEIPEELSIKFDNATEGHYTNRSEAIRHSMRILINRLKEEKGSERKREPSGVKVYHWAL